MIYLSTFSAVVFYSLIEMGQPCLDLTASFNGISFRMWDSEKQVGIVYSGVDTIRSSGIVVSLLTTTTDRETSIEAKMVIDGTD